MPLEREPDDAVEFDVQAIAQAALEPELWSDDAKAAPIWMMSQNFRELLEQGQRGEALSDVQRHDLRTAVLRQFPTLGLYRQLSLARQEPMGAGGRGDSDIGFGEKVGLYVLVFPGEAEDNTGIKDLNDILHYELNSKWIAMRQHAVAKVFWQPEADPPPKWITVGQDYKTAYIYPVGKTAKDFAADLIKFDKRLKTCLLPILDEAEEQERKEEKPDQKRLKAVADLRKRLNKHDAYRFPYTYGYSILPVHGDGTMAVALRLVTEALKAGAVVRWAHKRHDLSERLVKRVAAAVPIPRTPRDQDDRGSAYDNGVFLSILKMSDRIKATIQEGNKSVNVSYNITFVNGVWLVVVVTYNRKPYLNPDVVRDIRKKSVVEPKLDQGLKVAFGATVEFVELWLVTINMIDFVAGFVNREFPQILTAYHELALEILAELKPDSPEPLKVDWGRLRKFLTYDISQKKPKCVLGTTSEFTFYACSSDWTDQIFFSMDIRDLGVALATHYEIASEIIIDGRLDGARLMRATIMAGDLTVERKRVTHDTVVGVFYSYYKKLLQTGWGAAAQELFRPVPLEARLPDFDRSIQVMLGGDEVFVAAHPAFAKYIPNIIADVNAAKFLDLPLDLRIGLSLSSAKREGAGRIAGQPDPAQRTRNQDSHHQALSAASKTHEALKQLERTHRRIQLLIYKLENNPDKQHLAGDHQDTLDSLRLTRLYAQARINSETDRSGKRAARLRQMLDEVNVAGLSKEPNFDLFDDTGKKIAYDRRNSDAKALEASVAKDVGRDNRHYETPYMTQMPKWFKKVLDGYVAGKPPWFYDDEI